MTALPALPLFDAYQTKALAVAETCHDFVSGTL